MSLNNTVSVARRFQRSVRIDTDLGKKGALEGFICPETSLDVLRSMSQHVAENRQGAFTWTGPYGSGKSSLVIALSALLFGKKKVRQAAAELISLDTADQLWTALPPKTEGWRIVPVIGRRADPAQVIGEAIEASGLVEEKEELWTEDVVVSTLQSIAKNDTKHGGVIVFIDEMGKFLEGAALEGADVYLFQQLAEIASRSHGRLIIVGILHQAFEEYGRRLSREMRDEWTKIQGRFVDLSVNAAGEEQIDLLSRAIENNRSPKKAGVIASEVLDVIRLQRPNTSKHLGLVLEGCWPLHPVTACLLGPISKRRFGQNQRSLFGFLNSAEGGGFQDFINHTDEKHLYEPHLLWDYLRINLESAILASPDGHRWASAVDSLDRCEGYGGTELHLVLLKTIAIIDLFKERSGLTASLKLLRISISSRFPETEIKKAVEQLKQWSFIIYKKYLGAFAIFAGSDFDIDQAIESALYEVRDFDFDVLKNLSGIQPILAKRHFHETGTLRWFDVDLVPSKNLLEKVKDYTPSKGTVGQFLLVIPTENETEEEVQAICVKAVRQPHDRPVIVGLSNTAWTIRDRAHELVAVEKVRQDSPELAGDSVARREVQARLSALQGALEADLVRAFDSSVWQTSQDDAKSMHYSDLNGLASQLSDRLFTKAPKIHNELMNRHKPGSSANTAQNILLKCMVSNEADAQLGIEGFKAEKGLYISLLEATNLHQKNGDRWSFEKPNSKNDKNSLKPIWDAAEEFLEQNSDRSVGMQEIYDIWRQPPFGVRDGLMPVLAVAFVLTCRETLALYREGIYQANFKGLDVEYLTINPENIQIRWMDMSEMSRGLLSGLSDVVRELDPENKLHDLRPIDVARGLITIFDRLHPWTLRTSHLSKNALHLREIFKKAHDPNQLIFNDLPKSSLSKNKKIGHDYTEIVSCVRDGLNELIKAYPAMIERFYQIMLTDLGVPNTSLQSLADLAKRAENIRGVSGEFKLDGFAGRLIGFTGQPDQIEGLAFLAAEKPLNGWIDTDVDKANIGIAKLSQLFNQAEAFAHVKGRKNKRQAMALVISVDGSPTPLIEEFTINEADKKAVDEIVTHLEKVISKSKGTPQNIILAALSKISADYMSESPQSSASTDKKRKTA